MQLPQIQDTIPPLYLQHSGRVAIKLHYQECLRAATNSLVDALRPVVLDALAAGVARSELVEWGCELGYSKGYCRNLLSQLLSKAGVRKRKPGAGPKTPQESLVLLAIAREKYGARAYKFLGGAARAAKKEDEAQRASYQPLPILRVV